MNYQEAKVAVMLGMAGGISASRSFLEGRSDSICGTSGGSLELPPCEQPCHDVLVGYGFVFPDNYVIAHMGYRHQNTLFFKVAVPDGWRIVRSDHHLYKRLLDPKGRKIATIMYCHQDGDSWMNLDARFSKSAWRENWIGNHPEYACIENSDHEVVWCGTDKQLRDKVFDEVTNGISLTSKGVWDTEFIWPAGDFVIPDLGDYTLTTNYYHVNSGNYADGGSQSFKAANDQSAIDDAKHCVSRSAYGYILKGKLVNFKGDVLWSFDTTPKPVRKPRGFKTTNGYFCDYAEVDG